MQAVLDPTGNRLALIFCQFDLVAIYSVENSIGVMRFVDMLAFVYCVIVNCSQRICSWAKELWASY